MAGRKYSFTEQRDEELEFATVPLGSLVWMSSYPWPTLVNTSESFCLVQMLPTMPKRRKYKLITIFYLGSSNTISLLKIVTIIFKTSYEKSKLILLQFTE